MKGKKTQILVGLITLLVLTVGVVWLLFRILVATRKFLVGANPSVVAALIALMATTISGVVIASLTQVYNQRRDREEAYRPKKTEIYSSYMELLRRVQAEQNEHLQGLRFAEGELILRLSEAKRDFILWASPGVIQAQLDFELASGSGIGLLKSVDKLLLEIRKDLGLSNRGLRAMQLMKMQIKHEDWSKL